MILDRTLAIAMLLGWSLVLLFSAAFLIRITSQRGFLAALRSLFSARFVLFIIVPLVLISSLSQALVFIPPQEVGIVVSILTPSGYHDRPLRSGLHWIVPLAEEVYSYPIYWQSYTMSSNPIEGERKGDDSIVARTSDGQEVIIDTSIIFHVIPDQAVRIHINWQDRYIDDFVRPVTRGTVRTMVSQYTVDEVNSSRRLDIEKNLNQSLQKLFDENGFSLDFFVLRNIAFSSEYAAAVESKQVAFQGQIRKEYEAEQIRREAKGVADKIRIQAQADADAIRLKAKAEAEALALLAEALKLNDDLIALRYVDKIAPGIQVMLVPSNAPFIFSLPDMGAQSTFTDGLPVSPDTLLSPLSTQQPTEIPIPTPTPTPTPGS